MINGPLLRLGPPNQLLRRHTLRLRLEVDNHSMAQYGDGHRVYVLDVRNASPVHRRTRLGAEDEVL